MYSIDLLPYTLVFHKPAVTSRNVFEDRQIYYLRIRDADGKSGIGECAPLKLLSIDDLPEYETVLKSTVKRLEEGLSLDAIREELKAFPSILFGLETAFLDLNHAGQGLLFENGFSSQGAAIEINGLVWMSDCDDMLSQALEKAEQGFKCIKFKVGAQDFDQECRMLEALRKRYSAFELELRLDANGAFLPDEAQMKLKDLSRFEIHSIEQPIATGQWDQMAHLAQESKIDLALDEELIAARSDLEQQKMLDYIQPQYVILKPSLIGGLKKSEAWIEWCRSRGIAWWATSALESNVGLNAIAQWLGNYKLDMPQGLGTGALYKNNIEGPLRLDGRYLSLAANSRWEYPF